MNATKKEVVSFVKSKLVSDDKWALRALTIVFDNQTLAEQDSGVTIERNGRGFTGPDAEFLTSLAGQAKRIGQLSAKQMGFLHRLIPKYHAQVIEASKNNGKYNQLLSLINGGNVNPS